MKGLLNLPHRQFVFTMPKALRWGIISDIMYRVTNTIAESIIASILKIKAMACGFRNRTRFRTELLFDRGGLSMLPAGSDPHGSPQRLIYLRRSAAVGRSNKYRGRKGLLSTS
jgi:hypothetical protein